MAKEVDARGLPCPQPVIRARNAMEEGAEIVTIVDNETAQRNVTRMAEKSGARVEVESREDGIYLRIVPSVQKSGQVTPAAGAASSDGPLVLVVSGELMGRGEHKELGGILMRGFFYALGEIETVPDTIILFNSGIKLAVEGSPVVEDLQALVEEGVEILVCGTCLEYYGLKEAITVGTVSNMYTIAETMLAGGRVVKL
jgi:selenium metabolism protein YedF